MKTKNFDPNTDTENFQKIRRKPKPPKPKPSDTNPKEPKPLLPRKIITPLLPRKIRLPDKK